MRCGEEIELFTSSVLWAVWALHMTRDESPILTAYCMVYHIFHNTDT